MKSFLSLLCLSDSRFLSSLILRKHSNSHFVPLPPFLGGAVLSGRGCFRLQTFFRAPRVLRLLEELVITKPVKLRHPCEGQRSALASTGGSRKWCLRRELVSISILNVVGNVQFRKSAEVVAPEEPSGKSSLPLQGRMVQCRSSGRPQVPAKGLQRSEWRGADGGVRFLFPFLSLPPCLWTHVHMCGHSHAHRQMAHTSTG